MATVRPGVMKNFIIEKKDKDLLKTPLVTEELLEESEFLLLKRILSANAKNRCSPILLQNLNLLFREAGEWAELRILN